MRLYNTATQRIEPVVPRDNRITLYVCGITPYDTTHLGHAFTYVSYDMLVRHLRQSGLQVTYAQNVTDIDDDILRQSAKVGIPYDELGKLETEAYLRDMRALNVVPPDHFVKATSVIEDIVLTVSTLLERGVAYMAGGNVYFQVAAYPDYGLLSRETRQRMLELAAERGGDPEDPNKRDPLDFLLWQGHRAGEPAWPSPFGAGRPGWHIECSTIATRYLGLPVDIHGGGADLIFPHHSSEIAQVECATGSAPFVRYWMHTAMVYMHGEKMSKSLGNLVMIKELVKQYHADAIRLYLLSHHYRVPFEYNEDELREADELAAQLARALGDIPEDGAGVVDAKVPRVLTDALDDDLNTPGAIASLRDVVDGGLSKDVVGAAAWARDVLGLTLSRTLSTCAGAAP